MGQIPLTYLSKLFWCGGVVDMGEVGFVYILENKAMPDMWKIGITNRDDLGVRLKELFNTSVPLPFNCVYAAKVNDCRQVEKALQNAFRKERVHESREFFRVEPDRIIPLLELYKIEDVTTSVEQEINESITEEDREANNHFVGRRPNFKFDQMGIKSGSKITLVSEDTIVEATVAENNKVIYNGTEYSLTPLTQELLKKNYKILPLQYWKYNGKFLDDYYNETYLVSE